MRSGDFKENILEAISLGADTVEIHLADPEDVNWEELKELTDGKITICALGSGLSCGKYGLSLTSSDPEVCRRSQEKLKKYIDAAEKVSAAVVLGSIRGKNVDGLSFEEYEARLIENLRPVVQYAEEHRTTLLLELINHYELTYYNTLKDIASLAEKLGSPYFKVHLDTFHMNIEETSVYDSIAAMKGLLGHVHVADNTRREPGSGTFNFPEMARALRDIEYEGYLSMECFSSDGADETLKRGLDYIKSL